MGIMEFITLTIGYISVIFQTIAFFAFPFVLMYFIYLELVKPIIDSFRKEKKDSPTSTEQRR